MKLLRSLLFFIALVVAGYSISSMPVLPGSNVFEFHSENLIISVIIASIGMLLRIGNQKEKI